ncbi:MAG: hypothetical protein HYT70_02180 [Candidatus Aenigmarchaeota archaeon]|nr:hypothetical protein [Candidatus Aenigmarchaeota archaeon]
MSFDKIESYIRSGCVPIMLINYNKIIGKRLPDCRFVVVTGFDENDVYFHETGPEHPEPNRKLLKETFINAWNDEHTSNDVIIVFGRRKITDLSDLENMKMFSKKKCCEENPNNPAEYFCFKCKRLYTKAHEKGKLLHKDAFEKDICDKGHTSLLLHIDKLSQQRKSS